MSFYLFPINLVSVEDQIPSESVSHRSVEGGAEATPDSVPPGEPTATVALNTRPAPVVVDINMTTPPSNATGPKRRSAFGSNNDSPADLASLFECPVCFDYVLPPIFQCQAGHLVCSICCPKLTCCPTCRGPLGKFSDFI